MGVAIRIPRARGTEADTRLGRLRSLAWLLDRSIPIGRWRIGLDPLLGLMPGVGDCIGAVMSLYILYEGARLGVSTPVLVRMGGNVLVEVVVGAIPFLGDLFDFAWQANSRNLALIERHYRPGVPPRSMRQLGFVFIAICVVILAALIGVAMLFVNLLQSLMN